MTMPTPEGYNDHDYQSAVAFLEQTDRYGIKNGDKLSNTYNPSDPTTWETYDGYGISRVQWIKSDGELRIQGIFANGRSLCGVLDVSGCTALEELSCWNNNLTELNVSGCTALKYLNCGNNNLTELDVSDCTALKILYCYFNKLFALDVSNNTALEYLCYGNAYFSLFGVIGCPSNCEVKFCSI